MVQQYQKTVEELFNRGIDRSAGGYHVASVSAVIQLAATNVLSHSGTHSQVVEPISFQSGNIDESSLSLRMRSKDPPYEKGELWDLLKKAFVRTVAPGEAVQALQRSYSGLSMEEFEERSAELYDTYPFVGVVISLKPDSPISVLPDFDTHDGSYLFHHGLGGVWVSGLAVGNTYDCRKLAEVGINVKADLELAELISEELANLDDLPEVIPLG
jgi:hypothetical protein